MVKRIASFKALLVLTGLLVVGVSSSALENGSLDVDADRPGGVLPADCHPFCAGEVDVRNDPPAYEDRMTGEPVTVVPAGQSVTWTLEGDGIPHSVTSDPTASLGAEHFDSGILVPTPGDPQPTFEASFNEPGIYRYSCQVHAGQNGVLVIV